MNIGRDNYEAFFLDFAEGNLSAEEEEIVRRFLKFNPDLLEEFQTFRVQQLIPEKVIFPDSELLKKPVLGRFDEVNSKNFDFFCIAFIEGDLTVAQEKLFEKYLMDNPEFKSSFEIYRKTVLPVEVFSMPDRDKLKRRKTVVVSWKMLLPLAAAAAVTLMILLGPSDEIDPLEIAAIADPKMEEATVKESVVEEKVKEVEVPASLKVIRGSKAPVPVSDYKEKSDRVKAELEREAVMNAATNEKRMAVSGLSLQQDKSAIDDFGYDRLNPVAIQPLPVNPGSLSLPDLARYQFQKAARVMEEEDVLIYSIASSGLRGLNKITGSNVQLMASKDEEGAVSGIAFRSKYLNFTAPIAREE